MAIINKSAQVVGTVRFKNGNENTIHAGINSNTGATIMWQQVKGEKAQRVTGKNAKALLEALNECLNDGDCEWVGERNDKLLNLLIIEYKVEV